MSTMFRNSVFTIFFLLFGLSSAAWAQSNKILDIEAQNKDGLLEITVTFKQKPDLQLYQSFDMRRVVAKFVDTNRDIFALSGPTTGDVRKDVPQGVETWSLLTFGLSDVELHLNLNHRPQAGTLKGQVLENPWRAVICCQTEYRFEQELSISDSVLLKQTEVGAVDTYGLYSELFFDLRSPNLRLEMVEPSSPQTVSQLVDKSEAVCGINGASGGQDSEVLSRLALSSTALSQIPEKDYAFYGFGIGLDRFFYTAQRVLVSVDDKRSQILWQADIEEEKVGDGIRYPERPKDDPRDKRLGRAAILALDDNRLTLLAASGYDSNYDNGRIPVPRRRIHSGNYIYSGVTSQMMGEYIRSLKGRKIANLDGGRKLQLIVRNHAVSRGPADVNPEEPVDSALLVHDSGQGNIPSQISIECSRKRLLADGVSTIEVTGRVTNQEGEAVPDGTPIRFFAYHLGLSDGEVITQEGEFSLTLTSRKYVGEATLLLECGLAKLEQKFVLEAGTPSRVLTSNYKGGRTREGIVSRSFRIQVNDEFGNAIPNQVFKRDGEEFTTGERSIWWDDIDVPAQGKKVTIEVPGLPATQRHVSGDYREDKSSD